MTDGQLPGTRGAPDGGAPAVECRGLTKHYWRGDALVDCSFSVPEGRLAALVGPNGAGKSTFLRIAAGLTRPTSGDIEVLGEPIVSGRTVATHVGYVDQVRPLYRRLRVDEHLRMAAAMNDVWDQAMAVRLLSQLEVPLRARVGRLSVGQQAKVAVTLCLATRPRLMLLDEPLASLDPVARTMLMRALLAEVSEMGTTVVLSSHVISDLDPVCDYLIILRDGQAVLSEPMDDVRAGHHLVVAGRDAPSPPGDVVTEERGARQVRWMVRSHEPPIGGLGGGSGEGPDVEVLRPSLDEIVVAHLTRRHASATTPADDGGVGAGGADGVDGAGQRDLVIADEGERA